MSTPKTMCEMVDAYLSYRRQAGYALIIEGQQLHRFARFADRAGHRGAITLALARTWAMSSHGSNKTSQLTAARRIEVVRAFARFHQQFVPETVIPPIRLFGEAHRRKLPHIYSDSELEALLQATEDLHPAGGLRGASCRAVFGLLAATGMRISEATGLRRSNVDLKVGVIEVCHSKFGKSRLVPLHRTAIEQLQDYVNIRDTSAQAMSAAHFFVGDYGRELSTRAVQYAFTLLRQQLRWHARGEHPAPRIHDMRHTFICNVIRKWYESGVDIDRHILSLSTYVGHAKVSDTYWYVTATPELMAYAAKRFEHLKSQEVS